MAEINILLKLKNAIGAVINPSIEVGEFARISEKRFKDTEEARFDIPASLVSASIYVGVAPDGTATSAASWTIIRSYFDGSANPNRQRIRFNVEWDNRTAGW